MKQFLYLDTEIINSIIAQSEKGLIQNLSNEEVLTETETESFNVVVNAKGTVGGSIARLAKAEANLSGSLESIEGGGMTSTSREIINKTFHDAAFDIAFIIKAMRGLIPYNRMLISNDGYLVPLNAKFFRVDPLDLGFKYGGEITCVGMITNIIGADTNPNDEKNLFAMLQFTANEALRNILPTNENNLWVLHPIAIYYGK